MNRRDFLSGAAIIFTLAGCVEARIGSGSDPSGSAINNRKFEIIDPGRVNENASSPVDVNKPPVVAFDNAADQVVVTGTLRTGGTCKTATLQSATYDTDADSLTLTVTDVMKDGAENCGAVAGATSYRATIEFAQALPNEVMATEKDARGNTKRTTAERT